MDHCIHNAGDDDWPAHEIAIGDDRLLNEGHLLRENV